MLHHSCSPFATVQRVDIHACVSEQNCYTTGQRALILVVSWRRQQSVVDDCRVIMNLNALSLNEHVVKHL